jgi:hypothetical protein
MMIRVYLLPVEKDEVKKVELVKGIRHIHDAILGCTEKPNIRKLIMDTTPDEDATLSSLAIEVRDALPEEVEELNNRPEILPTRNLGAEIDEIKSILADHEARLKKNIGGHVR